MRCWNLIQGAAALTSALFAHSNIVAAQDSRVLKFVPQVDLALLDPIQTTAFVTRNHATRCEPSPAPTRQCGATA